MRAAILSIALACCVSAGSISAEAQEAGALCPDKPNLSVAAASLSRVDVMTGAQAGSVADDVLMVDFTVSVANNGGVDASQSRLRYVAQIRSPAGEVAEETSATMDIYYVAAGASEDNFISIMASKLRPLLQETGELAGSVSLKVALDVDNEIAECSETDNAVETAGDIKTAKVVE